MLQAINKFIGIVVESFRLFNRGKVWLFLLIIFFLDWLLLYAHTHFQLPLFYGPVTGWAKLVNKEYAIGFTHYPGHYMLLPYFFYRAKLLLGFFIEGSLLGAVALVFYRHLYQLTQTDNEPFSAKLYRWLNVSLAWLLLNGLIFLTGKYLPQILRPFLIYSPRRQLVFDYAVMPVINVLILALLFFSIAYIAIYRVHVINGIWNSIKLFFKTPIFMLFLSGVILIIPTLLTYLLLNQDIILAKFNPDLIYWILLGGLFFDIFVNFFWISTAVQLLIDEE